MIIAAWLLSSIVGGILGYLLYISVLVRVIKSNNREEAIQKIPFNAIKIILVLYLLSFAGILTWVFSAALGGFTYSILSLHTREEWDDMLEEIESHLAHIEDEDEK